MPNSSPPTMSYSLKPSEASRITPEMIIQWNRSDPMFLAESYDVRRRKPWQWLAKRTMDVTLSAVGLLLLIPLFTVVALLIRLESPGPVIYRQKRFGLHGRPFEMYKFRSMRQDAEQMLESLLSRNETNEGMFKLFQDPRVTRVGQFIRKYSIDELPQLVNVLRGDMSLVGPRPPIEREVQTYKTWHYVRFATLPGCTGLWQVSGRSRIKDFDTVVRMDYQYITDWTLGLDWRLLLKTIPVVLGGRDTA